MRAARGKKEKAAMHERTAAADKARCWHPFTPHSEWNAPEHDPLVLADGKGAWLRDDLGRKYIDGNSSIWTNLHGHRNPKIDAAIRAQIKRAAHTSFLGFTHPLAAELASQLVALWPERTLTRVFFSDDGSTAIEAALKMATQYWQLNGEPRREKFVAFTRGYHGDTMGASSVGGIPDFFGRFAAWQFPVEFVENAAQLEWLVPGEVAAVVIEPLIQGAAGMRVWPRGMLAEVRAWCDRHGVLLIADEVMTGFGRTGTMFACQQEHVIPDFLALAKGLTGGYLPLAATLVTDRVFSAFRGGPERTFYYGHSYTANALGCAAALASLAIFREENVLGQLREKIAHLARLLDPLRADARVREIRQCGFIAGIELNRPGAANVCLAARRHGLLTRPIRDTIVLMPPFCISTEDLEKSVEAIRLGIHESFP